jgi:CarD family transcriptional regulator
MFKRGDKILYPMHGAGVIENIEMKNILGEKRQYYILSLPTKNMKVMIPVDRGDSLNLREVINTDTIPEVFQVFKEDYVDTGMNWNKRYKYNLEKVKSGNIYDLANVIKDLMSRDAEKGLSSGERKMLNESKQLFVSEISLSSGRDRNEVENLIKGYF